MRLILGRVSRLRKLVKFNPVPVMLALEHRIMFDGAMAIDAKDCVSDSEAAIPQKDSFARDDRSTSSNRIIFIDGDIHIFNSLLSRAINNIGIIILGPVMSGLDQIANSLIGRSKIGSIQIVKQGSEDQVNIGDTLNLFTVIKDSMRYARIFFVIEYK